ncbi:MAG: alpha-glucan family phosphorylase [Bryobacterales bacterium]|nr:alpha-glucan family phosphorylase [Bryobacterales bacterium]
MAYQIQPLREFLMQPSLPPQLERLSEMAYNLLWSWEPVLRALFRRLDPVLWQEAGYNPVMALGRIPQETLERAAADPRYLALYAHACERFDAQVHMRTRDQEGDLIAYFSAEYGMTECLPIYSGGLGVLSGDHLKSASDCEVPLVGVGLLYQSGYFRQYLNPDGWQQERFPVNDFYSLPVRPVQDEAGRDLKVSVTLPSGAVAIRVWRMDVGRVRLYLLDTNIPDNALPQDRSITDQLYGGDVDTRIRQEIILGIGGMRALRALGLNPTVYHMNEGHSAFLALERVRVLMETYGLNFDEALEACRSNNVFTTHTPVPAGIDLFDPGMMYYYFQDYCRELGIPFDRLLALGRRDPDDGDERFSMAVLALKTSSYRNAVSRLHRHVSQSMWSSLWPNLPQWEVPITSVTNGVHLPSWLSRGLADLYDQYLQPDWRERADDPATWELVREIPDEELEEVHRRQKRRMITFARRMQRQAAERRNVSPVELRRASEVLDPNALTIGFARRFATYKRATLIFKDIDRLTRILCDEERPVQLVIAGKAHPKDQGGKGLIREIVQYSHHPELWRHIVFIEDYDMKIARELVQGCDIWLNNPRRGEEACGTSGMKAAMNGVLNLSILDGWFDEVFEDSGGWAIGERDLYREGQDDLHASAIYYLLENEIVPMYYARHEAGGRAEWMRRMKQSIIQISPRFDCRRMVREYYSQLYQPAHAAFWETSRDNFAKAREKANWNSRIAEVWDRVRFLEASPAPSIPVTSGRSVRVRAAIDLAGLRADDVRVEVVLGRVGPHGYLLDTEVSVLPPQESHDAATVFATEITPQQTGRLGWSLRITPNHCEDPLTRPCPDLVRWA